MFCINCHFLPSSYVLKINLETSWNKPNKWVRTCLFLILFNTEMDKHQIFWFTFGRCQIRTSVEIPTTLFEVICDFIQYFQANSETLRQSTSLLLRNILFEMQYSVIFRDLTILFRATESIDESTIHMKVTCLRAHLY